MAPSNYFRERLSPPTSHQTTESELDFEFQCLPHHHHEMFKLWRDSYLIIFNSWQAVKARRHHHDRVEQIDRTVLALTTTPSLFMSI